MSEPTLTGTLAEAGIKVIKPEVRSSDYKLTLGDPFIYFLRRRCGLVPALSWSKALSRGSWFAERMLYFLHPSPEAPLAAKLNTRLQELAAVCAQFGLSSDARHAILEREKKDYACAIGWYEASRSLPLINGMTYEQYFSQSHWKHLGSEVKVRVVHLGIPLIAQFDHLFYNTKNQQVWIIDDKTTAYDPHVRVQVCPNEFQSQLYTLVLDIALKKGMLKKYGVDATAKAAGIWHIALQKPTIEFGSRDRPFRYYADGVRKGFVGTWDGLFE